MRLSGLLSAQTVPQRLRRLVVYGGATSQRRSAGEVLSWTDLDRQGDWERPTLPNR